MLLTKYIKINKTKKLVIMNCLVTKLKATVNNPDLPVLEEMQQFTLDAIAASGNNNMTDAQKWALNNFFISIGAPGNTGVFAKTKGLFLPLICNDNINKAMYDYKNSTLYSVNEGIAFDSNHGLTAVDASSTNIFNNNTFQFADGRSDDLYLAVGVTGSYANGTYFKTAVGDSSFLVNKLSISSNSYTNTWRNQKELQATLQAACLGAVASKDINKDYRGYFITEGENVVANLVDIENPAEDTTGVVKVIPVVPRASSFGIFAVGTSLTNDECTVLATAIRKLVAAFK